MALINGTSGNDTLNGTTSADTIIGFDGNDTIFGLDGNDLIGGDNTDGSGIGNDSISAGAGDDTVLAGAGNDTVLGGTGNDLVGGDFGDDIITGDAGNDVLFGGFGNDILTGNDDADILVGNEGSDTMDGGAGNDLFLVDLGDGVVNGGAGTGDAIILDSSFSSPVELNLTLAGNQNVSDFGGPVVQGMEWVNASLLTVSVTVFGRNDVSGILVGSQNDDLLVGGAMPDIILGGTGGDTIRGGSGGDLLAGQGGSNVFQFAESETGASFITDFTIGSDLISIVGGSALDILDAVAGQTTISGGFRQITIGTKTVLITDTGTALTADDFVAAGSPVVIIPSATGDNNDNLNPGAFTPPLALAVDTNGGNQSLSGELDADGTIIDGQGGTDLLRITGDAAMRIDVTDPSSQLERLDLNGNGVFDGPAENNVAGGDNPNPVTVRNFEIFDAYPRQVLLDTSNPSDAQRAANYFGNLYYDGTGFDGDGINTDGNIVLAGFGDDTVLAGIGNDFIAGGSGSDSLFGGRNADFFFIEGSLLDPDTDEPTIDGGTTFDSNPDQDTDWALIEFSDDDEPIRVDLSATLFLTYEGIGTPAGVTVLFNDIENVDASGNFYGFFDLLDGAGNADVPMLGGARDSGLVGQGIGSTGQLLINGSEEDNILIAGYDNDEVVGQAGDDIIFGGNLFFNRNPNINGLMYDGRDTLMGSSGNDLIGYESFDVSVDGGSDGPSVPGSDTLLVFDADPDRGVTTQAQLIADRDDASPGLPSAQRSIYGTLDNLAYDRDDLLVNGTRLFNIDNPSPLDDATDYLFFDLDAPIYAALITGNTSQDQTGGVSMTGMENVNGSGRNADAAAWFMGSQALDGAGFLVGPIDTDGTNEGLNQDPSSGPATALSFAATDVNLDLRGTDADLDVLSRDGISQVTTLVDGFRFTSSGSVQISDSPPLVLTFTAGELIEVLSDKYIAIDSVLNDTQLGAIGDPEPITVTTDGSVTTHEVHVEEGGNNILIGGLGTDRIEGRGGDDILAGGVGEGTPDLFVFDIRGELVRTEADLVNDDVVCSYFEDFFGPGTVNYLSQQELLDPFPFVDNTDPVSYDGNDTLTGDLQAGVRRGDGHDIILDFEVGSETGSVQRSDIDQVVFYEFNDGNQGYNEDRAAALSDFIDDDGGEAVQAADIAVDLNADGSADGNDYAGLRAGQELSVDLDDMQRLDIATLTVEGLTFKNNQLTSTQDQRKAAADITNRVNLLAGLNSSLVGMTASPSAVGYIPVGQFDDDVDGVGDDVDPNDPSSGNRPGERIELNNFDPNVFYNTDLSVNNLSAGDVQADFFRLNNDTWSEILFERFSGADGGFNDQNVLFLLRDPAGVLAGPDDPSSDRVSDTVQFQTSILETARTAGSTVAGSSATNYGNDQLFGGAGNDSIGAGSGDDVVHGSLGNDTLAGGAGVDRLMYDRAVVGDVTINIASAVLPTLFLPTTLTIAVSGTVAKTGGGTDAISDFEIINKFGDVLDNGTGTTWTLVSSDTLNVSGLSNSLVDGVINYDMTLGNLFVFDDTDVNEGFDVGGQAIITGMENFTGGSSPENVLMGLVGVDTDEDGDVLPQFVALGGTFGVDPLVLVDLIAAPDAFKSNAIALDGGTDRTIYCMDGLFVDYNLNGNPDDRPDLEVFVEAVGETSTAGGGAITIPVANDTDIVRMNDGFLDPGANPFGITQVNDTLTGSEILNVEDLDGDAGDQASSDFVTDIINIVAQSDKSRGSTPVTQFDGIVVNYAGDQDIMGAIAVDDGILNAGGIAAAATADVELLTIEGIDEMEIVLSGSGNDRVIASANDDRVDPRSDIVGTVSYRYFLQGGADDTFDGRNLVNTVDPGDDTIVGEHDLQVTVDFTESSNTVFTTSSGNAVREGFKDVITIGQDFLGGASNRIDLAYNVEDYIGATHVDQMPQASNVIDISTAGVGEDVFVVFSDETRRDPNNDAVILDATNVRLDSATTGVIYGVFIDLDVTVDPPTDVTTNYWSDVLGGDANDTVILTDAQNALFHGGSLGNGEDTLDYSALTVARTAFVYDPDDDSVEVQIDVNNDGVIDINDLPFNGHDFWDLGVGIDTIQDLLDQLTDFPEDFDDDALDNGTVVGASYSEPETLIGRDDEIDVFSTGANFDDLDDLDGETVGDEDEPADLSSYLIALQVASPGQVRAAVGTPLVSTALPGDPGVEDTDVSVREFANAVGAGILLLNINDFDVIDASGELEEADFWLMGNFDAADTILGGEGGDRIYFTGDDGDVADGEVSLQGGDAADDTVNGEANTLAVLEGTLEDGTWVFDLRGDVLEGNQFVSGPGSLTGDDIKVFDMQHFDAHEVDDAGVAFQVTGTDDAETIIGGAGNDTILGLGGADWLDGGDRDYEPGNQDGDDEIDGGAGNDTLTGGSGGDTLTGGADTDTFRYVATGDSPFGVPGQIDTITDLQLAELLDFSAIDADEVIPGDQTGPGNFQFLGSFLDRSSLEDDPNFEDAGGRAVYGYDLTSNRIFVYTDGDADPEMEIIVGPGSAIAALFGTTGDDAALVDSVGTINDTVSGGPGNNTITSVGGDDVLVGNDGNDSIVSGDGNDLVHGSVGNDTITDGGADSVTGDMLFGDDGNDSISAGAGPDTADGGRGDDTVLGEAGSDTVLGGDGNDSLDGGTEADSVDGGVGNDTILGGDGNDTLSGGTGNDSITGGNGVDEMTGGTGVDRFDFNAAAESPLATPDTISGFEAGSDIFDFATLALTGTGVDENLVLNGFTNVATAGFFQSGAPVLIEYLQGTNTARVFVDVNNDQNLDNAAGDDLVIDVTGVAVNALSPANFAFA